MPFVESHASRKQSAQVGRNDRLHVVNEFDVLLVALPQLGASHRIHKKVDGGHKPTVILIVHDEPLVERVFNVPTDDDGSTLKQLTHGKGRIFWTSYPVELSENAQAISDLYTYVASQLNINPIFAQQSPIAPGVLVFPTVLGDSVLYVFISDSADDAAIKLRDESTGVPMGFNLPAEHAAIAVIGKKEKKIVARYGF